MELKDVGKISVVIPAYNHEKFIGAAIESVLQQDYDNLELIIVNDGSTDDTDAVIRGYNDSRIRYFVQENQDAYNTINRGMSLAEGDYIAILNSDDIYADGRLSFLRRVCQETDARCLFTDVIPIDDDGVEFKDPDFGWNVWHQKNRQFYKEVGDIYRAFLKGNFMVTTSNLFMRADAVRKVGKFCSLRYLHDYDYIFRMMLAYPGQVLYLEDEKLLYYRIHPGNTLGEAAIVGREQDKQVIRNYMLAPLPEEYREIVATGSERLLELENELHEVRRSMEGDELLSIKQACKAFLQAVKRKIIR